MRHAAIYFAAITLFIAGAETSQAQIAWQGKLRDAHGAAKQQGKLMLLHFYTDNCVYCDRLESGAYQSQSVAKAINDHFVPVKVHGGKNPKLAKMFQVSKYPTDVIVTTDGKALSHRVSPQLPQKYIAMLANAQSSFSKNKTMLAKGKQPPAAQTPAQQAPAAQAQPAVAQTQPAAPQSAPVQVAAARTAPESPQMASAPMTTDLPVKVPSPNPAHPRMQNVASAPGSARQNQFVLPTEKTPAAPVSTNSVNAQLTGVQLNATRSAQPAQRNSFVMPASQPVEEPTASPAASLSAAKPELAIQGYCPVSVVQGKQWIEGKPEFGVIHLGRLYLFADQASMDLFLEDPMPFTPMLNEIDVVRFFEEKKIVPGKREWGVIDPVHNRMFFFSDEAAMLHFEKQFDRYVEAAIEVMDQAVAESNPGV